ncbi:CpXC domain-containing protein [Tateyamaria sp.]|uniref:CpXC domain-containing protein n=1 Tax=Tateyamaria sp. TaxID=1929288 RepID=UPI00329DD5AB
MSLFRPKNLTCPSCKALITMDAVGSINADRRPDYRDDILNNKFQDTTCGSCNATFRLQPDFNYLDAGRGQWIAALPAARMPEYLAAEDESAALFSTSYGDKAPKAAQVVGKTLAVRLTFGWPAVREKLLLREHDLDDAIMELVKLDVLRRVPSAPMKPGVELRAFDLSDDNISMVWLETDTEASLENLQVPRALYRAIAETIKEWEKVHTELTNGAFVDLQKLYMGRGRGAAHAAQ